MRRQARAGRKTWREAPRAALLALSLGAAALGAGGGATAEEIGVVKHVAGVVTLTRDGAEHAPEIGDPVHRADVVRTGAAGAFGATLRDGTTIALGRESAVEIAAFAFEPSESLFDLLIRALAGRILLRTGLIGEEAPERVRVETPKLVVGVRGTRFGVVVEDGS